MAKKKTKSEAIAEVVEKTIADLHGLDLDPVQRDEAIDELEDLLDSPEDKKKFYGYHPITGAEVWL